MDRRDFLKGTAAAGMAASMGPVWLSRALAAEPRPPMGKDLGANETLLLCNANLVDVIAGKLYDETALLIRGGKIVKLLAASSANSTQADRSIDAGGRYVIPGIINAHCHVTMPGVADARPALFSNASPQIDRNLVDCVTHGVTTVRDQLGRQDSIVKRQESIARGELMGPRVLRGVGIDVPRGYFAAYTIFLKGGSIVVTNEAEARDAVAKAVDMGADHIKISLQYTSLMEKEKPLNLLTDDMMEAIVAKAESMGKHCAIHHTSLDGFRRAMRAGVQCFEHMSSDLPLTDKDIENFIDHKRIIVPTGSVAWALAFPRGGDQNFEHPNVQLMYEDKEARINEVLDEYALPPLSKLGKKVYRKYSGPGFFDKNHLMLTPSARMFNSAGAIGGDNMVTLFKAGARVGCGNDGGIPFVWPGSMPLEMLINQKAGIAPKVVLKAATAVNAEIIGMEDELGTIEAGKLADLAVYDNNPLDDMENLMETAATLRSGRLVYSMGGIKESYL